MRVTRLVLLVVSLFLVALPLAARPVPTLSSASPADIHRNSGEWFVRLNGTGLYPLSGVTVTFTGPPGTITRTPNAGTDSYLDVWIPERVVASAGNYTITVTATDATGKYTSNSIPFRVIGSTIRLEFLELLLVEAISRNGGFGRFEVTATSQMSEVVTVQCSHKSGELYPIGDTYVDCYAEDDLGGSAKGRFTLRVADTTPPAIKTPQDLIAFGEDVGAKVAYDVSVSDAVDLEAKADCSPASGTLFPVGTSLVNCVSKDAYGNIGEAAFRVHVGDEARPALVLPSEVSAELVTREGAYVEFAASATDIKGNPVPVECSAKSGGLFPPGFTTVKCVAGRSGGEFVVSVTDNTAPTLELPRGIVEQAPELEGTKVVFYPAAKDAIDGETPVLCAPASGSFFAPGKTTVNCSSEDSSRNIARGSFVVEVLPWVDPKDYVKVDAWGEVEDESQPQ